MFLAVLTAGLQHYVRLFAAYGTLWPSAMIHPLPGVAKFSPLLAMVERMNRAWVLWELAAMFPLALLFVAPWNLRVLFADLRAAVASDVCHGVRLLVRRAAGLRL